MKEEPTHTTIFNFNRSQYYLWRIPISTNIYHVCDMELKEKSTKHFFLTEPWDKLIVTASKF